MLDLKTILKTANQLQTSKKGYPIVSTQIVSAIDALVEHANQEISLLQRRIMSLEKELIYRD